MPELSVLFVPCDEGWPEAHFTRPLHSAAPARKEKKRGEIKPRQVDERWKSGWVRSVTGPRSASGVWSEPSRLALLWFSSHDDDKLQPANLLKYVVKSTPGVQLFLLQLSSGLRFRLKNCSEHRRSRQCHFSVTNQSESGKGGTYARTSERERGETGPGLNTEICPSDLSNLIWPGLPDLICWSVSLIWSACLVCLILCQSDLSV